MNTLCHLIPTFKNRNSANPAIQYKIENQWIKLSWKDYSNQIIKIANGLTNLGVKKNSKVVLISNTRWEWSAIDFAVMGLQAQIIPVYQNCSLEELEYILDNCEAEFLIVENKNVLRSFYSIQSRLKKSPQLISIETCENTILLSDLMKQEVCPDYIQFFEKSCLSTLPENILTIIYTSGTTGTPKGVVLTHEAAYSEVSEAFTYCGADASDVSLSFLPYAHILGRIESWGHAYIGFTMAYAENIEKVRTNLSEIKPTILISVPRIFEKIYAMVKTQVVGSKLQRQVFDWAINVGLKVGDLRIKKLPVSLSLALEYEVARQLVLSKVKDAFGGNLRFAISGGAPLNNEISLFFHACEILILEGYGLTETTAAITVNTPFDYRFGSVGKPIGETQIKIADDGEVLVKSKKVMKEYFKLPEETKNVFTDGWFHTGDIGEILSSGDLKITDRKKDLIKTAGGKYVAPQKIEGLLKLYPWISNVLIHGDQRKYIVALIALDKNYILEYAEEKQIVYSDYEGLTQHPTILNLVKQSIIDTNSQLASFESIKRYAVLSAEFSIEEGDLTPSLKVKRKYLDKKWAPLLDSLYA